MVSSHRWVPSCGKKNVNLGHPPGDITDPQTLNRYTYVRNNPVNLIDPSGLKLADCYGARLLGRETDWGYDYSWDLSPEYCLTWGLDAPDNTDDGGDGGGGGGTPPAPKPPAPKVNLKVLQDCINQLLGNNTVTITSFKPSTPGGFGEFKGVGPDAFSHGGRVVPIAVKNDAATYNATQVGGLCGVASALGCTAPGTPGYPYTNYTNNNDNVFGTVATQIHELGHSLWVITAGSGLIPQPNDEAGRTLENCATMNHGIH